MKIHMYNLKERKRKKKKLTSNASDSVLPGTSCKSTLKITRMIKAIKK